jgi:hypothetical protein
MTSQSPGKLSPVGEGSVIPLDVVAAGLAGKASIRGPWVDAVDPRCPED